MKCRFENVPNRLSATVSAQRSAPQYGQDSSPMNSTSGLPFSVSGELEIVLSGSTAADPLGPAPTLLRTATGTLVTSAATAVLVLAVVVVAAAGVVVLSSDLAMTKPTTMTITRSVLPPTMNILR